MTGCLIIYVTRLTHPLECDCDRVGEAPALSVSRIGDAPSLSVSRSGSPLAASASRVGTPPKVECSLVCTTDDTYYLRVTPELIWLVPENGFSEDVTVVSNVRWTIE
jgi:hypothetical protein